MDKDYLIQFNTDGTRLNTYANNAHYQIFEDCIVDIAENFSYEEVINNGGIWFTAEDYNKLIGNVDGKEYIYIYGEIIEKPPYIPTEEEKALTKIDEIMQANDEQLTDIKDAMLVAVLTDNITLQAELKTEYNTVIADTNKKLQEVKSNGKKM